jgi:hypothetical protein
MGGSVAGTGGLSAITGGSMRELVAQLPELVDSVPNKWWLSSVIYKQEHGMV